MQPRVPTGRYSFVELPAGMLDQSGDFAGVAAKELKEETGIEVPPAQAGDVAGGSGRPSLVLPTIFPIGGESFCLRSAGEAVRRRKPAADLRRAQP